MIRSGSEVPLRLIVTTQCMAHCEFCHFEGVGRGLSTLSEAEIDTAAEMASRLSLRQIQLSGGEPLLRPDMPATVERILELHPRARISVTSNGLLLTPELSERLCRSGVSKLNVNLAAWLQWGGEVRPAKDVRAEIERLAEAASPFVDHGRLELNFPVVGEYLAHVDEVLRACIRLKIPLDIMTIGWHPGLTEERYRSLHVDPASVLRSCLPSVDDVLLRFEATPHLELLHRGRAVGKLKDAGISRQFRLRECPDCRFRTRCPETSCAIRVYPGWRVGRCLLDLERTGRRRASTQTEFRQAVLHAYAAVSRAVENLSFLRFGVSG